MDQLIYYNTYYVAEQKCTKFPVWLHKVPRPHPIRVLAEYSKTQQACHCTNSVNDADFHDAISSGKRVPSHGRNWTS